MKYGEVIPEGFNIPKSAFWLKADLEKRNPFELLPLRKNDTVMDCGAYIGTFTAAALEQGAKWAVCYECAPKNVPLLEENMRRYGKRVTIMRYAIVGTHGWTKVKLNLSGFSGANSVIPSKNRPKFVEVEAVSFRAQLRHYRPTILKIDVEGAEYEMLESLKPGDLESVHGIFIEFHPHPNRENLVIWAFQHLTQEGFKIVSDRNRAYIGVRV